MTIFRIDKQFRDLIPPLTDEEFNQLEQSILAEGVRDPLVVWQTGNNGSKPVLIEGHHRHQIIKKHKISKFHVVKRKFESRDEVLEWIIDTQCGRRNLPLFTKCLLQIQKSEMTLKHVAKANQRKGAGRGKRVSRIRETLTVDAEIARATGVSKDTVHRVRYLTQNADPDILKSLLAGATSINQAYTECRKAVRHNQRVERMGKSSSTELPDGFQIICGDAVTEMKKMPDAVFDAVITDPPYGVGFTRGGKQLEAHDAPEAYGKWLTPVVAEMERVLKPGGFMAVFQSGKNFRYLWDWFGDDIVIYGHCRDFVQMRSTMPINFGFDPVVVRYKPGADPICPLKPQRNMNYFVSKTSGMLLDPKSLAGQHPCPRPLDQLEELITNFVCQAGHVFDPFCGSGTTGVACCKHGRSFVGVEKEKKYVTLSRKRIRVAYEGIEG